MDGKDSFIERFLQNTDVYTAEQVQETIQLLLEHGIKWQASDIHIEPHSDYVLVRYRVDGMLRGAHKIPRDAHKTLVHHLKLKGALRTSQPIFPQNGIFQATIGNQVYDVEISTMPVIGGEKVVLHITTQVRQPLPLNDLGLWGYGLQALQIAIGRNHGLTLVSAPRHHGRPMTMASLINTVQNPSLNIMTIEEKLDYQIAHANQTVVNSSAGFSILHGLQAALHQDPNVLLISNIPDKATAELVIQTALSGHLVVAGTHSDSTAATLIQLLRLGVAPYLLATGVKTIIAQRVVRKLCEQCREQYALSSEQLTVLYRVFGISTTKALQRIHELERDAMADGLGYDLPLSSTAKTIRYLWRARKGGCDSCAHTGYQNRVCLAEVLVVDDAIQQALNKAEQTAAELQIIAVKNPHFIPLALDGLIKALRGLVTIKDVLRVVDRSLRLP